MKSLTEVGSHHICTTREGNTGFFACGITNAAPAYAFSSRFLFLGRSGMEFVLDQEYRIFEGNKIWLILLFTKKLHLNMFQWLSKLRGSKLIFAKD